MNFESSEIEAKRRGDFRRVEFDGDFALEINEEDAEQYADFMLNEFIPSLPLPLEARAELNEAMREMREL